MNYRTSILLVTIFHFFSLVALGQDKLAEDLVAVNTFYSENSKFKCNVTYNVYKNYNDSRPLQTETGLISKKGKLAYNEIGKIIIIQNTKYSLLVNDADKQILLLPVNSQTEETSISMISTNIKAFSDYYTILNYTKGKITTTYTLATKSGEYSKIEIEFNNTLHYLTRLVLYYRYPTAIDPGNPEDNKSIPKIEIFFDSVVVENNLPDSFFTYNKYLDLKNQKLVPKEKYKNYYYVNGLEN